MTPAIAADTYPDYPLWRYAEDGYAFRLSNYNSTVALEVPFKHSGRLDDRPDWLKLIVDMAHMDGTCVLTNKAPPPDRMLWFVTDPRGGLVEFLEV